MQTNQNIGKRIKLLREARGLSQQEVATEVNVSRVAVTKREGENTPNLKIDNLIGLSRLFKLSIDELITGSAYHYGDHTDGRVLAAQEPMPTLNNIFERRKEELQGPTKEVVSLMSKMDDGAKFRLAERAKMLAEEFPAVKPNSANSSQ